MRENLCIQDAKWRKARLKIAQIYVLIFLQPTYSLFNMKLTVK